MSERPKRKNPQLNRVTVDLGEIKPAWLKWCKEQGVAPSAAFRQLANSMMQRRAAQFSANAQSADAASTTSIPGGIAHQIKISLTTGEIAKVKALAAASGTFTTQWMRDVIRKHVRSTAISLGTGCLVRKRAEQTAARIEIRMTPSELQRMKEFAKTEDISVQKWIVAAIRSRLTAAPQFNRHELEVLAQSNRRLYAIDRTLEEVVKLLNRNPHPDQIERIADVEGLANRITEHANLVTEAIARNEQRWKIV